MLPDNMIEIKNKMVKKNKIWFGEFNCEYLKSSLTTGIKLIFSGDINIEMKGIIVAIEKTSNMPLTSIVIDKKNSWVFLLLLRVLKIEKIK